MFCSKQVEGFGRPLYDNYTQFSSDMLNVPNIGSSNTTDLREIKIDKTKVGQWKSGGLTNAEIYLCQKSKPCTVQKVLEFLIYY